MSWHAARDVDAPSRLEPMDFHDGSPRWAAPGPDDDLPQIPTHPLRDVDDVLEVALSLVGPERAGPPALWIVLLDADGMMLPVVLPLVGVPLQPDAVQVRQVVVAMGDVLAHDAPGGSIAVALVRAAGGDRGAFERAWEHALRVACDDQGVRLSAVVAVGEHRARVLGP
ncbi:hypothetical protein Cfla_1877 [Cellulomonas flavigena DSM 20109]|uniref:Uncharacterized protein n=1 Tax=Cellulomonas flavigena (strain ATCC 482 / DSM 20109 / BCRC 11376 / JCM 18109 / NBRC 3775 / NCIMB 8073 / NRS 134) TaxID=446466 RepID=D5UEW4_CELFN|nr:hypothetical protein [Cellulomonas flavigena]ADG74774.1 hypothetical protein Cfla_1877 [Cellulomonas flavigena DSM 20109]